MRDATRRMQSRKICTEWHAGVRRCASHCLALGVDRAGTRKARTSSRSSPHAGAHCARRSTVQIISNVMQHVRPYTVQRAIYAMHVAACNTDHATHGARHTQSDPHGALPLKPTPCCCAFVRLSIRCSSATRCACLLHSASIHRSIDPRRDPCCAPVACIPLGCSSVCRTLCCARQGKAARSVPVAHLRRGVPCSLC